MTNISGSLIGLSMLTGSNSFFPQDGAAVESSAVRIARAAFTTPATTAPWKQPAPSTPASAQLAAIRQMASLIDRNAGTQTGGSPDVETSFITYKALDRMRLLAERAASATTSSTERASLETVFARGLADLQDYLAQAPGNLLSLSFGQPGRQAQSIGIRPDDNAVTAGAGVVSARDAAIPGLAGNEVLKIDLSRYSVSDSVTVDLSGTTQPPTLDSVAQALNAAIASVPMLDTGGNPVLDAGGNPVPRWQSRFTVEKHDGQWGLVMNAMGSEKLSIDQVGAPDALMVASGQTMLDAPTSVRITRFDDPAGGMIRRTLGTISAYDRPATEQAKLNAPATPPVTGAPPPAPPDIRAAADARALTTDAQGNSYVIGTTAGDLGAHLSDGNNDLYLTKLDSEGRVIWQRTLGSAGEAQGAAVSIAANGDIVVAGTVRVASSGSSGSDSDMLVARFDASGDQQFATSIRALGEDSASAVTVGTDGSIYVGGKAGTGGGDAFIARLDSSGTLQERRSIDSGGNDNVTALAIGGSGELLALTKEGATAKLRSIDGASLSTDLGSVDLGSVDARALAVSASGEIAVAGATYTAAAGTQVNGLSGGRDGFVTRIDASLAAAATTYVGSSDDDQLDSITFMGSDLYAGGRTTGTLGSAKQGPVDGFVTRIDTASGTVENISQFGQSGLRTEPVRVSAAVGGGGVMGALGLHRGTINNTDSTQLTAQTNLRAGDSFSIRVDEGAARTIAVDAGETLASLADKVRRLVGTNATVTTPNIDGKASLTITVKSSHSVELVAGPRGKDALGKLGMKAARLYAAPPRGSKDPVVKPGGNYGLGLTQALNLNSARDAATALDTITAAISMTQTAYRSLYWDSTKESLVNTSIRGSAGSAGNARIDSQIAQYQAALDRLTGGGN